MPISEKQAAQELILRRERRESLVAWSTYRRAKFDQVPAKHHLLLLNTIQAAIDDKLVHPITGDPCKSIIFLLPPGTAKSTYLSVDSIPWILQRKPTWRVLACSHKAELIERFSRECRNCVEEEQKVLGYSLCADRKGVSEWATSLGGGYQCAGVGAGISGSRAHFAAVDDYIGAREDADSLLIRDKQWHWYWNDFLPRTVPETVKMILANRQHEDDLVGRLLDKQEDRWVLIKVPFFAEDNDPLGRIRGEAIWPERYGAKYIEEILQIKKHEPRTYAGLYQQRPAPEEGNFFKKESLRGYTQAELDELMKLNPRIFVTNDFAVSELKGSNRNCFMPGALDQHGVLYILPDIFWKVAGPKESSEAWLQMLKRRNPIVNWAERGHISMSIGPFLKQRMLEEEVYCHIEEVTPSKTKDQRAQGIRGRMDMGMVRFPKFATWWNEAENELLTFPGGKNDDFVDALSLFGLGLPKLIKSHTPQKDAEELMNQPFVPTGKWLKAAHKPRTIDNRYQGR